MLFSKQVHSLMTRATIFTSFLFLLSTNAFAGSYKCSNEDVTVYAEQYSDIPFACAAADKTFTFLRKAGLKKQVSIDLHIVNELPKHDHLEACFGYYERKNNSIYLLSYNG
ncbi:MAG: hypothetical protein GY705_00495 [Bacteroidetes bacterium]|nr:hypothetical protein [Bacteroidota bacterium]